MDHQHLLSQEWQGIRRSRDRDSRDERSPPDRLRNTMSPPPSKDGLDGLFDRSGSFDDLASLDDGVLEELSRAQSTESLLLNEVLQLDMGMEYQDEAVAAGALSQDFSFLGDVDSDLLGTVPPGSSSAQGWQCQQVPPSQRTRYVASAVPSQCGGGLITSRRPAPKMPYTLQPRPYGPPSHGPRHPAMGAGKGGKGGKGRGGKGWGRGSAPPQPSPPTPVRESGSRVPYTLGSDDLPPMPGLQAVRSVPRAHGGSLPPMPSLQRIYHTGIPSYNSDSYKSDGMPASTELVPDEIK